MSAIDDTPTNFNFLSPLGFKFIIKRAPNVNFFVQETMIPGLSVEPDYAPNPVLRIPISGEHIIYEDYEFTFKVDEDMKNWLEIYNWLTADGKLTPALYAATASNQEWTGEGIKSDISVTTLTGTKMPNMMLVLHDAFPIRLTGFKLQSTDLNVEYVVATAFFKYTWFELSKLVV
jgi:hypothetical protein